MSKNKQAVLWGIAVCSVLLGFTVWVTCIQAEIGRESGRRSGEPATPTAEVTPDTGIAFIDGLPTAVSFTNTPTVAPTHTATPTQTPTVAPTHTETPKKPTNTPKPTKTPTPTPKPQNGAKYEKGTAGTKYAETNGKHGWKPWARHTAVTNKQSPQYKLEQVAKTDELGRRIVQDARGEWRFLVALPVYWAGGTFQDVGRLVDIKMANGTVLKCVLADIKKIEHSYKGEGKYGSNGEVIEVICDGSRLIPAVKKSGNASNFGPEWKGDVESVTAYDEFIKY